MAAGRKRYRARKATFGREHGTTISQAEQVARLLRLPRRASARAIDELVTSSRGLRVAQDLLRGDLTPYGGRDAARKNAELRVAVEDALYRRQLEARALDDIRRGVYGTRRAAEQVYGFPVGTLARRFGSVDVSRGDREPVPVQVVGPNGAQWVLTRGSEVRAEAFAYRRAVIDYRHNGNVEGLERFRGRSIGGVPLVADPAHIDLLYERGAVEFGES
jgi:hypothetical protein